ncbi:MAG: 5'-methylthioadenosine/adenosylhomocysteine nucleosidase [Gammaproteobacteria bacterium]|nr:5'-methylthioadenosine/adenosylhomocysteine nucleosidase [Gammaproteobacteria bacterium]
MKIAIVAAMLEELEAIKNHVNNIEEVTMSESYPGFKGTMHHHEVICFQAGIGKVNAAITTTLLIERYQPDYLINTGVAGGIGEKVKIGDVVIATELRYHDADATALDCEMGQIPQMPAAYYSDNRLNHAIHEIDSGQLHKGLIVSGDSFIGQAKQLQIIKKNFPAAQAVEMESCAIAQTCDRLKVPYCIIRSVSDAADSEANQSFEVFLLEAAANSAAVTAQILKELDR